MKPRSYLIFFLCWIGFFASLSAQEAPLIIAVTANEPFTMHTGEAWTGPAIDLWEKIAELNKWSFRYAEYPTAEAALKAVTDGNSQVFVGDTSITSKRLALMDFSQPFFRSGLQIMVLEDRPHTFGRLFENLLQLGHLRILWIAAGVVVLFTVLVTFFERRHNPDFPKAWGEGLADAFYNVMSITLTGKSVYKGFPGVLGRLLLVGWMILGLFVVAYVTSSITTTMTVEQLQGHIHGPADLPGKTIAVLTGTSGEEYARDQGIQYLTYDSMTDAVNALMKQEVAAVVSDAPTLQYFDNQHPKIPITEVGPIFSPHNYGFALPKSSALRIPIDQVLVSLSESGFLHELGRRYFGEVFVP